MTMLSVAELKALGYFRTSRKFRHASRIDRPDWLDVMAKSNMTTADFSLRTMAHHYRVCHSKDTVVLATIEELLQLEHSAWTSDETGYNYIPKPQESL